MFSVTQTEEFRDWLLALSDRAAARKIAQRIIRLQSGLMAMRNSSTALANCESISGRDIVSTSCAPALS